MNGPWETLILARLEAAIHFSTSLMLGYMVRSWTIQHMRLNQEEAINDYFHRETTSDCFYRVDSRPRKGNQPGLASYVAVPDICINTALSL
jgi:hypothetical protein